jgi:hypothetical protein
VPASSADPSSPSEIKIPEYLVIQLPPPAADPSSPFQRLIPKNSAIYTLI